MAGSSSPVERPILRLLLMALMGLALASRLALGATVSVDASGDAARATDSLSRLQAAMIMCHRGDGHGSLPAMPRGPLLADSLLFDQADNAHAVAAYPVMSRPLALLWSAPEFVPVHAASSPVLWRPIRSARGPPPTA